MVYCLHYLTVKTVIQYFSDVKTEPTREGESLVNENPLRRRHSSLLSPSETLPGVRSLLLKDSFRALLDSGRVFGYSLGPPPQKKGREKPGSQL